MKKISLFLLASLFSLGVIAQTGPTTPVNTKAQPVKPTASPTTTGTQTKTTKAGSPALKNNLKKTGTNKKTAHVTPVQKATPPAQSTPASNQDLKK